MSLRDQIRSNFDGAEFLTILRYLQGDTEFEFAVVVAEGHDMAEVAEAMVGSDVVKFQKYLDDKVVTIFNPLDKRAPFLPDEWVEAFACPPAYVIQKKGGPRVRDHI